MLIDWFRTATLLSLVLFVCVNNVSADDKHKWGEVPSEEWSLTAPAAFPDASAAVIFDIGSFDVPQPYKGNQIIFDRHVRTKIFSKVGSDAAITVEIPVFGSEDFRRFEAQTILPNGKKFKVSKNDLLKKRSGKNLEYMTFTFPAVEDGCIVEYKYKVGDANFGTLNPWYFQGPFYTYKSVFSSIIAPGLNYTVVSRNVPEELRKPTEREIGYGDGKSVEFTWSMHDLSPIEPEPYMAAAKSYYASLYLQLFSYKDAYNQIDFISDWASLAEIVENNYTNPALDKDGGIKEKALELAAGMTDSVEIVERLYDFVRLEILTDESGEDYYLVAQGASKVLSELRGSGTSKNILLTLLLRKLGFTANPVLISTRSYAIFNPQIYDLGQFNHLICQAWVGSRSFVLDASDRWVPFPYLPFESLVGGGLLIDGKNSKTITIKPIERKTGFTANSRMVVAPDGSATCNTHLCLAGHMLSAHKELLETEPDAVDIKESLLDDQSLDVELLDFKINETADADSVGIDLTFLLPNYCDILENNISGEPLLFTMKSNPFTKSQRAFPVDFGYPFEVSETVEIALSDSLSLKSLPENLNLGFNGLRYTRFVLKSENQARVVSQLIVSKGMFVPNEYKSLRDTFEQFTAASSDPFIAEQK